MSKYLEILYYVYLMLPKLQSNWARKNARLVAEAATRGHIGCVHGANAYNSWFITPKGLAFYNKHSLKQ